MTQNYGIDTSILVRLATGDPETGFQYAVRELTKLVSQDKAEVFVSNQVLGEAYIALQHHYGASKTEARKALLGVLKSGLITPLNGASAITALDTLTGCGLLDRLIADDYQQAELTTLTLDRKMAALPQAKRL
jgi:predicted nucleic acid-binding protein